MKKKNNTNIPLPVLVFTSFLCGLLILLFLFITYKSIINYYDFKQNGIPTTATITEIITTRVSKSNKKHDVYIKYTNKKDEQIETKLNYYSSEFYEKMKVKIRYMPDNPDKVLVDGSGALLTILIPFLFAVFILTLLILAIKFTVKD